MRSNMGAEVQEVCKDQEADHECLEAVVAEVAAVAEVEVAAAGVRELGSLKGKGAMSLDTAMGGLAQDAI